MDYEKVVDYVKLLHNENNILSKSEFIRNTNIDCFCPVIEPEVATFIKILLELHKPKNVLELGTSIGYSTVVIASTLKKRNIKLLTIDNDKFVTKYAKENFKKYNVENYINLKVIDAFKYLDSIENKFDFIFLDLYNDLYSSIFEKCLKVLSNDGIMLIDDTLYPISEDEELSNSKMEIFNKEVSKNSTIESIIIPLGDGITLIKKK